MNDTATFAESATAAESATIAESRRQDLLSKLSRRMAQLVRTKTLRPRTPTPLVSFTFDDIPASAGEAGAACLERAGARGTFYVAGGLCGRRNAGSAFSTGRAVAALAERGHEIGCHTFSHPDLQTLGAAAVREEAARNAAALLAVAPGLRLRNFAYPYGSTAWPQKRAVQRRYRSGRGTREGINRGTIDLGQLLAVRLYDHLLGPAGVDDLLRATVEGKGWLVFYTHDVATRPSAHGCSPGLLEAAIAAAHRHICPIVTVDAALDRLGA